MPAARTRISRASRDALARQRDTEGAETLRASDDQRPLSRFSDADVTLSSDGLRALARVLGRQAAGELIRRQPQPKSSRSKSPNERD